MSEANQDVFKEIANNQASFVAVKQVTLHIPMEFLSSCF